MHQFQGSSNPFCLYFLRYALQIARSLGDRALEAQACYSLGNTHTLMQDYARSIEFHLHHMSIAQELGDRVGESRACWSLGNAYMALSDYDRALPFVERHLSMSKEVRRKGLHFYATIKEKS